MKEICSMKYKIIYSEMFLWEFHEVIHEFFAREETSLSKNDIGQMIYFNLTKAHSEKLLRILE